MKEDGEGARALHSVRETTFRERAIAEDIQLAICMATHSRLGAASPIAVLTDTNLLREVCWQRRTQARSARNHTHTWRHARTRARARAHTHTHTHMHACTGLLARAQQDPPVHSVLPTDIAELGMPPS